MDSDDYLKKGYHVDRYHALEDDLLRFLDYITLEFYSSVGERQQIRSMYLADLLLRIGSNIDIFFSKYIISNSNVPECSTIAKEKKPELWNWGDFKKVEPSLHLSDLNVEIIATSERIYPFRKDGHKDGNTWDNINKNEDFWWNSYNKVKHEGVFDKANLDNVIQALAALFLLVCRVKNSRKLMQYGYLGIDPSMKHEIVSGRTREMKHPILTNLFISSIRS
jgi:hypothetical protein